MGGGGGGGERKRKINIGGGGELGGCSVPLLHRKENRHKRGKKSESQSRSVMLHHQDQPLNLAYGGKGGTNHKSSSSLQNRKSPLTTISSALLEPSGALPEIESGDDGYGRVPPDGAEERRLEGEKGRMMMSQNNEKHRDKMGRKGSEGFREREEDEDEEELDDDDEWGDSDSESEFSCRSGGSMSSLNMESGGEGMLTGGWDRIGVGEPKSNQQESDQSRNGNRESAERHRSFSRKSLTRGTLGNVLEEGTEEKNEDDDQSSDSDGELPELMDAVWTLRDRERFKAQEMEKHQVQLTMYRRLALIRWVRTLQGRIQEQQNRLQTSFDVILTHRKELLRMGAAAAVASAAPPTAAVAQS
ncbi:hypothetical protein Q5P01_018546 [Channa striata]|uniref:Uncharacterized protein n=1 Tax=Channa striata TaxID=64152 RepID=A0AA88S8E0_CHASR|nr:hypothetical protein Q5P01_018546 [Channa striata]